MSDHARYRSLLRETAGEKLGAKPPQRCGWCGRFVKANPQLPAYADPLCKQCYLDGEGYMERPGQ